MSTRYRKLAAGGLLLALAAGAAAWCVALGRGKGQNANATSGASFAVRGRLTGKLPSRQQRGTRSPGEVRSRIPRAAPTNHCRGYDTMERRPGQPHPTDGPSRPLTGHSTKSLPRVPYSPALDGLRAIAILAVLVYHAEAGWMPGGFLGVEVFFVISGYLITSILLAEWRRQGAIHIARFWQARARRLLAALFFMIVSVMVFVGVFLPSELARLRSDAIAAATYMSNWYLLFHHQPYFETFGRPSLLLHLWSLAVEEQFYIVWPIVLSLGLKMLKPRLTLVAVLAAAAASTLLMAALYQPDVDHSRLYYGTDTRAAALLLGAALAFVWAPGRCHARIGPVGALGMDVVGAGALALLLWLHFWLTESRAFLYRGGFASVGIATATVIASTVRPEARLGRLVSLAPLRWLGVRSYSLYLWHWPVFVLTRPNTDLPMDGLALLGLRLAVTLVLTEFSYRFVETPIRGGLLGREWRRLCEATRAHRYRFALRYAGVTAAAVGLLIPLGVSVVSAERPAPPPYLSVGRVQTGMLGHHLGTSAEVADRPPIPLATATPGHTPPPTASAATVEPATTDATPAAQPATPPAPVHVSAVRAAAIGDSVMLGAVRQLTEAISDVSVDAAVGRQVSAGIEILRGWRDAGLLGDVVIVHLGNNGTFTARQFDKMMEVLGEVRLVLFVNVKVPRSWEGSNNAVLADGVGRYQNTALVDWHSASANRPDLFWDDGIHLRPEGARLYANLIASALAAYLPPTAAPTPIPADTPAATPQPTLTATPAPTASPTSEPTRTPTPGPTHTSTPTLPPSPIPPATATATASPIPTPTAIPTPTPISSPH